jgi:L-threonylcarbamoyladenylate synthase
METVIGTNIQHAAKLLMADEVVAIPTETVYGLAGNACSETALLKIFNTKQRPLHNPLILHVASLEQAMPFCLHIPETVKALTEKFWPGPLTLLLPKKPGSLPNLLNNNLPEIAVRVPDHPLTLALLNQLPFPLAAPSANPFGYISPTTPEHVLKQLGGKIPYILDGGPCKRGIESTIVRVTEEGITVLRPGAIPAEKIAEFTDEVHQHTPQPREKIVAPGMLDQHYAPRTPLTLLDTIPPDWVSSSTPNRGFLLFNSPLEGVPASKQIILSASGDLREAAENLYAALHALDTMGLDEIVAEKMPPHGLGVAINDRLLRASH